jgi:toxin ParE1/3/4
LAEIWIYTHDRWGRVQADLYSDRLRASAYALLANPKAGRVADFNPGIRRIKAERHFIYFRVEKEDVLIVRILHERMDTSRHLP